MPERRRRFIPAAGHDWFLPLYDPFQRWLGEASIKQQLVDQAELEAGQRVLDIGCGTGSLAILLKRRHPDVTVLGLDPDPKALRIARRKAGEAAVEIEFERGFADSLPYPDGSFERVFSSFMFHHLSREEKRATLLEVRRALGPHGSLHLLDFGSSKSGSDGWIARLLHHHSHLRDNAHLESLLESAGFARAAEVSQRRTLLGTLCYYRAS